jgi:hypothetical protein
MTFTFNVSIFFSKQSKKYLLNVLAHFLLHSKYYNFIAAFLGKIKILVRSSKNYFKRQGKARQGKARLDLSITTQNKSME